MSQASPREPDGALRRFMDFAVTSADLLDLDTLLPYAAKAATSVPDGVAGAVVAVEQDGVVEVQAVYGRGTADLLGTAWDADAQPGRASLAARRLWAPRPEEAGELAAGSRRSSWILGAPLHGGEGLLGALYAFGADQPLTDETRQVLRLVGTRIAVTLQRAQLLAELEQRTRQLAKIMETTSHIAVSLDFPAVAQRIVEGVTEVTDFQVATLTLRDGSTCRRVAASGLADPRLGMETEYAAWAEVLRDEYRLGTASYLVPPEATADWADVPKIRAPGGPGAWTADHGLAVLLHDQEGDVVGFLSVDEPRSGRLPAPATIESLELFARQVQVAFVNARLYGELRRASRRDSLTGLRNRAAFWVDIPEMLKQARPGSPVALAVVDADRFKLVNDRYGHVIGDQVLLHVADRLTRSVRQTDAVYRIGGEEFTILMPAASAEQARMVLERARAAVRRNRADLPQISVSAGVAEFPSHADGPDELFTAADEAMYAAKRAGRDRVVVAGEDPGSTGTT